MSTNEHCPYNTHIKLYFALYFGKNVYQSLFGKTRINEALTLTLFSSLSLDVIVNNVINLIKNSYGTSVCCDVRTRIWLLIGDLVVK